MEIKPDHILDGTCVVCGAKDLIVWFKPEINGYACTDCAENLEAAKVVIAETPDNPEAIEDNSSEDASREHYQLHTPNAVMPTPLEANRPRSPSPLETEILALQAFFEEPVPAIWLAFGPKDRCFVLPLGIPWVIAGLLMVIWIAIFPWDLNVGIGPCLCMFLGAFLNYRFFRATIGFQKKLDELQEKLLIAKSLSLRP